MTVSISLLQPLLLNPSLLIRPYPLPAIPLSNESGQAVEVKNSYIPVTEEIRSCWKNLKDVICDFLEECVNYDPPFPVDLQLFAFYLFL